jgi:hypothetical protein
MAAIPTITPKIEPDLLTQTRFRWLPWAIRFCFAANIIFDELAQYFFVDLGSIDSPSHQLSPSSGSILSVPDQVFD